MQILEYLNSQNIEAWMVKPLSAGCVNIVVACWILITSDYISQATLWSTPTRNRKFTLCGFISCILDAPTCTYYPETSVVACPMDTNEAHRNVTMSLLLPGKVLYLNALLALRKFKDRSNKAGAVHGFEILQESNLGKLISLKPQRGATMVRCNTLCANWVSSNHNCYDVSLGSLKNG